MTWIRKPLTGHSAVLTGKYGVNGPRTRTGNDLPTIIIVNNAPRNAEVNGQEARYHNEIGQKARFQIANGQEHQMNFSGNGLKVLFLSANG